MRTSLVSNALANLDRSWMIVGQNQIETALPHQLFRTVADDTLNGGTRIGDDSPFIHDKDDIRGILGDRPEILLALPERIFRPLAFAYIAQHREDSDSLLVARRKKDS